MRKLTRSLRLLITLTIILTFSVFVSAQYEKYSVPAKWELYSVTDEKVSFLMPRLPILIEGGDQCRGEKTRDYAAYTDGVVYTVRVTSKVEPREACFEKRKFNEKNFLERINELKQNLIDESNSANNISKNSVIKLTGKNSFTKLINDFDNNRWFEFAIYGADEAKTDVKSFLASIKIEKQTTGIEIGRGAEQVFGDDVSDSIVDVKTINDKDGVETENVSKQILVRIEDKTTRGLTIITKPRSSYTEAARQSKIQGKVVLLVRFLGNGGIGDITVISGLSNGLTEEAIKAARKIVFIPLQGNGRRYTVAKRVEYTFTIF